MKPPLWLILHAAAHASMASKEQLFLLVTEPRSGSDWLVDLLDAHPNVCVPAGRWVEKGSGDKHNGIDGHALVGVSKAKELNASGADVGAAYEAAADYRLAHPLRGPIYGISQMSYLLSYLCSPLRSVSHSFVVVAGCQGSYYSPAELILLLLSRKS